ncbi:DUF2142 domain-containing protein [Microbacterium sp. zg.Y1084]|uniref:DUF2142 domain-containing protein n=2 Tax=Microbacterium TaxID=33882 RepID=UPI00214CA0B9|nr:DUF2142 domain-containing protein [Microbacterium sp. zg.Y1084]MCR2813588.1 DUF2142 domain-containing protein [Microbacterium sp. zg.Y1084]MDL5486597.1 DUF2142 domain-containing protein [Microbacterium sp. zg-Y1211]
MALLCGTWALLTPQFLSPDESAHFSTSVRVSEGFTWPEPGAARFPAAVEAAQAERRTPHDQRSTLARLMATQPGNGERVDQMTQHPPLYYLLTGGALAVPGVKDLVWDQSMMITRLLGALLAAPLVWLSWNAIATLTRSRAMGLVGAVAVFAVPQLSQTMAAVTNDSLAVLMAWTVTWLAIKVLRGDRRLTTLIALGLVFGAGCLVKGTVVPLGLLVALAPWFSEGGATSWTRRLRDSAIPLVVAFAAGGWWWARNLLLYRTLQPHGFIAESKGWEEGAGPNLSEYIDEVWRVTPTTFWGWFGRVNVPLSNILVDTLTVSCLLLLAIGLFRKQMRTLALVLSAPVAATALLFIRTSWSTYAEGGTVRGLHGRYFFTVLLLLIALAAIAASNVIRDRSARVALAMVVCAGTAMLTLAALAIAGLGFYADSDLSAWLEGLKLWLDSYSPLPRWATLAVPAATVPFLVLGTALAARTILHENSATSPQTAPAVRV